MYQITYIIYIQKHQQKTYIEITITTVIWGMTFDLKCCPETSAAVAYESSPGAAGVVDILKNISQIGSFAQVGVKNQKLFETTT